MIFISLFFSSVYTWTISPAVKDTSKVAFDTLNIFQKPELFNKYELPVYTISSDVEVDSVNVTWAIDGNTSSGIKEINVSSWNGFNSKLQLYPNIDRTIKSGKHLITATIQSKDTLFSVTWNIKIFATTYTASEATLTEILRDGSNEFSELKVLDEQKIDSTIFDIRALPKTSGSLVKTYFDMSLQKTAQLGDTIKRIVFQINYGDNRYGWEISDDYRIRLNRGCQKNDTITKLLTRIGKIGPLFSDFNDSLRSAEPQDKSSVYNDSLYWHFVHTIGTGDCPAGCIYVVQSECRITKEGQCCTKTTGRVYPGVDISDLTWSCPNTAIIEIRQPIVSQDKTAPITTNYNLLGKITPSLKVHAASVVVRSMQSNCKVLISVNHKNGDNSR